MLGPVAVVLASALLGAGEASAERRAAELEPMVESASELYGLPRELIHAVIRTESNYRSDAVSSAGAIGLMQLMPETARAMGVDDPYDPWQNIHGGCRYLAEMLRRFDGHLDLALSAYNAGPQAVEQRCGGEVCGFTLAYVQRVLARYHHAGGVERLSGAWESSDELTYSDALYDIRTVIEAYRSREH